MKARSALLVVSLVGGLLGASAQPANAVFHFIKVREVYAGSTLNASSQFVELQMYSSGQNLVAGHSVVVYNNAGGEVQRFTFTGPVANGQNQRTILVATTQAQNQFGVTADLTMATAVIPKEGGKVCFDPEPNEVDCVAWGNTTGTDATGPPFNPAGGIPDGQSIERKIGAGCSTLLEAGDDTNNSANDFQPVSPNPESNSAPPNETGCGGAGGGGGGEARATNIKAKVRGSRAIVTGKIQPPAPGDKVTLTLSADGERVGKKKDALDPQSRFKKAFRLPSGSSRCKVTVRYEGDPVGKKKFAC